MSDVRVDWSSAQVSDGTLEVWLTGDLPSGFKDSFDRAAGLLGRGDWGKVKCKRDRLRVRQVGDGSEDRLRHFLESAVLQASRRHEGPDDDAVEQPDDGQSPPDSRDAEMTERFRSFADGAGD